MNTRTRILLLATTSICTGLLYRPSSMYSSRQPLWHQHNTPKTSAPDEASGEDDVARHQLILDEASFAMAWIPAVDGSVVPAQEHDDAALDDVEPGPLLLEGLAESPLPPLASNEQLHCVVGWRNSPKRAMGRRSYVLLAQVQVAGIELVSAHQWAPYI